MSAKRLLPLGRTKSSAGVSLRYGVDQPNGAKPAYIVHQGNHYTLAVNNNSPSDRCSILRNLPLFLSLSESSFDHYWLSRSLPVHQSLCSARKCLTPDTTVSALAQITPIGRRQQRPAISRLFSSLSGNSHLCPKATIACTCRPVDGKVSIPSRLSARSPSSMSVLRDY